jgi:CBS domain-containing protein
MKIQHILNTKGTRVVTIPEYQPVRAALVLLVEHKIGSLVVVDGKDQPIGLLSERNIIQSAVTNEGVFSETVGSLMTREMIMGAPDADLEAVAHTMTEKRTRHVLVMEAGQLVGIISIGDVVKAQRDQYQGEVYTLETMLLSQDV